jgi:hypothetical protein
MQGEFMSPDQKLRLTHIAEAAALIADYLKSVSKNRISVGASNFGLPA